MVNQVGRTQSSGSSSLQLAMVWSQGITQSGFGLHGFGHLQRGLGLLQLLEVVEVVKVLLLLLLVFYRWTVGGQLLEVVSQLFHHLTLSTGLGALIVKLFSLMLLLLELVLVVVRVVVREPLLLLVVPVPLPAGVQCKLWLELFRLEHSWLLMLTVVVIVVGLTVVVLARILGVVVVVVPLGAPRGPSWITPGPIDFTDSGLSVL